MVYKNEIIGTPVTSFTTQFATPSFDHPSDGGILYSNSRLIVHRQSEAFSYTVEVSNSASTWGRTRYVETIYDGYNYSKRADEIKVGGKYLQDGTTYYARTRINYLNENNVNVYTDYSPVISFIYRTYPPAVEPGDADGNGVIDIKDVNLAINIILGKTVTDLTYSRADADGNGTVDIDDINIMINAILGKGAQ